MAKARKRKKAASPNMIVWVRLPKGLKVTARGPQNARLARLLKKGDIVPRAGCFGGDTCIV
jgi:hypothetical protein